MNGPAELRRLLGEPGLVVAPFCFDGLQAKLAVAAGFPAVYLTGFGTAASYGLPDVGLLGLGEMGANVSRLAAAVAVPVVADADTGFGNAVSVVHTVETYARAGAAALHLEDQVWPKRCGFMAGKEVIPLAEAAQKVRAAAETARALGDAGPVIIARTDALAPHGWPEVEARARAFRAEGADLIFVDGIRNRADALAYADRLGDLPLVYNGMLPVAEVAALAGMRLMLASGPFLGAVAALRSLYGELAAEGRVAVAGLGPLFDEVNELLGLGRVEELRQRYDA